MEVHVEGRPGGEPGPVGVTQGVEEVGGERGGPRLRGPGLLGARTVLGFVVGVVQVEVEGVLLILCLVVWLLGVFEEELEELGGAGEVAEGDGADLVGGAVGVEGG